MKSRIFPDSQLAAALQGGTALMDNNKQQESLSDDAPRGFQGWLQELNTWISYSLPW